MDVTKVPLSKHLGIRLADQDTLILENRTALHNHIQTIHASVQFALAETQCGLFLQQLFPEYVDSVVPIVRASSVKYKKPAIQDITASALVCDEAKEAFLAQFERRGRGSIEVEVEVRDNEGTLTMQGVFTWFIQKIDSAML